MKKHGFHFQVHPKLISQLPKINVSLCFLFILVPSADKMLRFLFYFGVFAVNLMWCVLFVLVCSQRRGFAAAQHDVG